MRQTLFAFVGAAALLCAVASCGEYGHTNPYDPLSDVSGVIAGPDSSLAVLDTVRFTLSTSVEVPDLNILWSSTDPTVLQYIGNGAFITHQTEGRRTVGVVADVGPHRYERPVTLTQRVTQFRDCPGRTPIFTPYSFNVATYGTEVCVQSLDAHGVPVTDLLTTPGTLVSRNPTVVRAGTPFTTRFTFDALQDGTSWLVLTPTGGAPDSLLVTVLRRITLVAVTPSSFVSLKTGQSVQFGFLKAYDAQVVEITNPATIGTPRFLDCSSPAGGITVTPDGLVTGVSASPVGKVCLAFTRDTVLAASIVPPPPPM